MTQHDPTAHTGAFQRHSDARREPAATRPRHPHGEPAAWPAEIPDPNSLPTDWSPSGGYSGEPGGAPVAWLPAPTEPGDAPASRSRPESSRNTTMGPGRTTTDRDRNPWVVTPVPDRIPAGWDDTAVPDSIPQSWADDTRHRAEPPTATGNTPSGQGWAGRRSAEPDAATEQWHATRPGPSAEPPTRSWHAAPAEPATTGWHQAPADPSGATGWNRAPEGYRPDESRPDVSRPDAWVAERAEPSRAWNVPPPTRHQAVEPATGTWNEPVEPATGSWHMTGRATRDVEVVDGSWQGRPEGGDAAGVLVPRTEAGSSVLEKPETVTPTTRRNPRLTLVAALIAAALAGGGVGAGIVAFTGGGAASSAPAAPAGGAPGGQAPGTQPSQAAG